MKFTCDVATLKRAVALVKLDEPKTHLSITAQEAEVQLRCETDNGHFCIDHTMPAEVETTGTATIPGDALLRICEYTTSETLQFSAHEWHGLDIKGDQHRHAVRTHPKKWQSPALEEPTDGPGPVYEIPTSEFGTALNSALFAAEQPSDSETDEQKRVMLMGALFHLHDGEGRIVTTDGRRMVVLTVPSVRELVNTETPISMQAMPYKACVKMIGLIESLRSEVCRLRFAESAMAFEVEGVVLRCLWPGKDYPDYLRIFKEKSSDYVGVKVNRESLLSALRTIYVDDDPAHRTTFRFSDGELIVGNDTNFGKSEIRMSIQYEAPDLVIIANSWLFEEALVRTDATDVTLWIQDAQSPIHLELTQNFRYLVMPMR